MLVQETNAAGQVKCRDGRVVTLYSLVPLFTEERDLEIAEGIPALFRQLKSRGVSFVVDPNRINAVLGS